MRVPLLYRKCNCKRHSLCRLRFLVSVGMSISEKPDLRVLAIAVKSSAIAQEKSNETLLPPCSLSKANP